MPTEHRQSREFALWESVLPMISHLFPYDLQGSGNTPRQAHDSHAGSLVEKLFADKTRTDVAFLWPMYLLQFCRAATRRYAQTHIFNEFSQEILIGYGNSSQLVDLMVADLVGYPSARPLRQKNLPRKQSRRRRFRARERNIYHHSSRRISRRKAGPHCFTAVRLTHLRFSHFVSGKQVPETVRRGIGGKVHAFSISSHAKIPE